MDREIMNKLEKINYRFITDDDFVYSASEVLKTLTILLLYFSAYSSNSLYISLS